MSVKIALYGTGAFVGQPEEVAHQIEQYRDAGINYFIGNFEAEHELEVIRLFAEEVFSKLGD